MKTISKLALFSALSLSLASGVLMAQQAPVNEPPAPQGQMDNPPPPPPGGPMAERGDDDGRGWGWRKHHHRWNGEDRNGRGGPDRFGRHERDGRDGPGRGFGPRMMLVDVNGDGVISDDEASILADRAFMRLDRDRDGSLSEEEFTSRPGPRGRMGWMGWGGKEEAEAVLKVRKDKFVALDADKNGSLTKLEFFAEAKTRLAEADADKDGKVTPWEFRAALRP